MGKRKGNNKGFSLVELLCAVAIFSLVVTTAGAVMVFTSRSYRNSTSETTVQQEAQFAANRIGGLIQDATEVTFDDSNPDNKILTIKKGDAATYEITHDINLKELKYSDGTETAPQVLAENIRDFVVNADKFDDTKTVELVMAVTDGIKNYDVAYTMTARNDEVTIEAGDGKITPVYMIKLGSPRIVMVPGEELTVKDIELVNLTKLAEVSGYPDVFEKPEVNGNEVKLKLKTSAGASTAYDSYNIKLQGTDDEGVVRAEATIEIAVRRVERIGDNNKLSITSKTGIDGRKTYTFHAKAQGVNLAKVPGAYWDTGWVDPQKIVEPLAGGVDYYIAYAGDTTKHNPSEYFEEPTISCDSNETRISFVQKKPLNSNMEFHVRVKSAHADGQNKGGAHYADIYGEGILKGTGFKQSDAFERILEPGEKHEIVINGLKGGDWAIDVVDGSGNKKYPGIPESDNITMPSGTSFVLDESSNKLTISVAPSETGYSTPGAPVDGVAGQASGEIEGNILVNIRPKGSTEASDVAARVWVGVRRVTGITLTCKQLKSGTTGSGDEKHPRVQEPYADGAQYQFRAKVEGTHLNPTELLGDTSVTDVTEATKNINPYAIRFYWQLYIKGKPVSGYSDDLLWDNGYNTGGDYTDDKNGKHIEYNESGKGKEKLEKNEKPGYFFVDNLGVMGQDPLINITLKKEFPMYGELRVAAQAEHAYGGNKNKVTYGAPIAKVQILDEDTNIDNYPHIDRDSLYRDMDVVIVEPNQTITLPIKFSQSVDDVSVSENFKHATSTSTNLAVSREESIRSSAGSGNASDTWYIDVHIGRDERGIANSTDELEKGAFILDVTGVKGDNKEPMSIKFLVRRVEEIQVRAEEEENKEGKDIELTATVTGCGVEKYEKDNNIDPYYFKKMPSTQPNGKKYTYADKDSDYKYPCAIEWSYSTDNKGHDENVWKKIVSITTEGFDTEIHRIDDEYIEYYQLVRKSEYNECGIVLHLKKAFPSSTEIRAHSLHAGNPKLGDSAEEYKRAPENVNKTKIYYADYSIDKHTGINGYYRVRAVRIPRGSESDVVISPEERDRIFANIPEIDEKTLREHPEIKQISKNDGRWFWRSKDLTAGETEFNGWRRCIEYSQDAQKLNADETSTFKPSHKYVVEMGFFIFDDQNKISSGDAVLRWPHDQEVANEVTNGRMDNSVTANDGYSTTFTLNKAVVQFSGLGGNEYNYGSMGQPIVIDNEFTCGVTQVTDEMDFGKFPALELRVEKLVDGQWVEETKDHQKPTWNYIPIRKSNGWQTGCLYRAFLILDDSKGLSVNKWNGNSLNPAYTPQVKSEMGYWPLCSGTYEGEGTTGKVDFEKFTFDGEKGYIYFEVK